MRPRATRLTPISLPQPLDERVDKAGVRQRTDPTGARERRARGRAEAGDEPGWWWFDGDEWSYYGEEDPP